MFQSLIGWLQTDSASGILTVYFEFQSLIGWLQTYYTNQAVLYLYQFQSLIGWLQTELLGLLPINSLLGFNPL